MSWAEYIIRVEGYLRQERRNMQRDRRTWYNTLIGPHLDPKRLPKTEQAYMKIPGEKKRKVKVSEAARSKFIEALEEYKRKKEQSHGGGPEPQY